MKNSTIKLSEKELTLIKGGSITVSTFEVIETRP